MSNSTSLNITILGTAHPFRGGLASYNERLATEFQNEGHQVKIITFTTQYPNFLFPGKTQYSEEPAPKQINIEQKVSSINPLNWIKVGRQIKKDKPDILIFKYWLPFMGPCFGTIARIVKKNRSTKIITILDNVVPHEGRIGDRLFTKYFVRPNDGFISMSKKVENDLALFDTKKPRLFNPHPLFDNFGIKPDRDEALRFLNLNTSNRYILFFGIIRDYKGLDLLLEGFKLFDFKKHNVKLLVAGEYYSNEEKYQALIKKLGLDEHIIVINQFIKDSEVGYYFSAADLVAQPYKNATQSGVTQIAYHFETPILVTNVGGLPEMVPHDKVGYVVEKSETEIAKALTDFYENQKSTEFVSNLKVEKEKYTWDKMTSKIRKLATKLT